jgi:outer membrane receptor protein involved in Fe transport
VRLALNNITDQENWSAANPFYGNDFLIPDLPFNVSLTVRYKF